MIFYRFFNKEKVKKVKLFCDFLGCFVANTLLAMTVFF